MVKHKPKVQISNWDEKYIILIRKSVANSDKKYGWRQKGARTVRSSENQDGKRAGGGGWVTDQPTILHYHLFHCDQHRQPCHGYP